MIISNVNIGSGLGANDGESIYSAFYKVNQNFANIRSNVDTLTNSVSSVAGRTGNITLTINDIVGLNTSYAINANLIAANLGMKGYVDSVASQSIYGNSNVASYLTTYTGNIKAKFANISGVATTGLEALIVGTPGIEPFGNIISQFHGNVNNDLFLAVHNKNSGNIALSGFMATSDIGDELNYRLCMAVVSSTYNRADFLKPLDSVILGIGGNLIIGSNNLNNLGNPVKDIVFTVGDGSTFEVLRIHAQNDLSSANLELGVNVGIKFKDNSRQLTAYTATYANTTPTPTSVGVKGDIVQDGSYIYHCIAANTWVRSSIATSW